MADRDQPPHLALQAQTVVSIHDHRVTRIDLAIAQKARIDRLYSVPWLLYTLVGQKLDVPEHLAKMAREHRHAALVFVRVKLADMH